MYLMNKEYTFFEEILFKLCYDDNLMRRILLIDIFLIAFICSFIITEYQLYIQWLNFYHE